MTRTRRQPLTVWYHGTSKENAESILREGFRVGTYFGKDLADALFMGGAYVFAVSFPKSTRSEAGWQMTINEPVPVGRIVQLRHYQTELLYENEMEGQRVFASNMLRRELVTKEQCEQCGQSLAGRRWEDLWHRDDGLTDLCSSVCAQMWDARLMGIFETAVSLGAFTPQDNAAPAVLRRREQALAEENKQQAKKERRSR